MIDVRDLPVLDVIFLTGPTASGKTSLALEYAELYGAEIVSADAYQVYAQFPILSAAPTQQELQRVPHHLIGFLDAKNDWDAANHARLALARIEEIRARGRRVVISGGSGLYLKFISHGIAPAPPSDEKIRKELEEKSLEELVEMMARIDPEALEFTALQNRRYVVRNLEIILAGGKPLSAWRQNWNHPAIAPGFVISRDVEELDKRIYQRTAEMWESGVAQEVSQVSELSATASKILGLAETRAVLSGEMDKKEWIQKVALATRQYAKRQRTWFRRETWLTPIS